MLPKYKLFLSNALKGFSELGLKSRKTAIFSVISFTARVTLGKVHPEIFSMQFKRVKYLENPLPRFPPKISILSYLW